MNKLKPREIREWFNLVRYMGFRYLPLSRILRYYCSHWCAFVFIFWFEVLSASLLGSIFPSCKPPETIFKITFWLGYLNSCINPIIYPCFSQEFKKAFHSVLRGQCLRTAVPTTSQTLGHITTHSSDPGPVQEPVTLSSLTCCRVLSTSSSSADGVDQSQSAQGQSKSLLKAWCFSASQTPVPEKASNRSAKVLHLSLSITGEAVWQLSLRHLCKTFTFNYIPQRH